MDDIAEQRKEKVLAVLKKHQSWIIYLILGVILLLAFFNRIAPLDNLKDVTTGDYIPIEIDSFVFLRYAQEILVNGTQSAVDTMRYFPDGYPNHGEFTFLSTFIVYLYKFMHFFSPSVTLAYADVLYPPIIFVISLLFFFLLVRRLFDYRVALLATVYLAFIPTYVQRTVAGFSDKESMGMLFFFMILYFFVTAFYNQKRIKAISFGILAGILTMLMANSWGGVHFLFLILGVYILLEVLLNRLTDNNFYAYASWYLTTLFLLLVLFTTRYTLSTMLFSVTGGATFFAFVVSVVYYLLHHYDFLKLHTRFKEKLPLGFISFILSVFLGIIFITIFKGVGFIYSTLAEQIYFLVSPFAQSRWGLTVAESHQPYMRDFVGQLTKLFFFLFLSGAVILFYHCIKPLKEDKKKLTIFFALFALAFTLNRYAPDSVLNGDNTLSLFLFFGSFILFFTFIFIGSLHAYHKRREHYIELLKLNGSYLLVLIWFFVTIVGARTMVRLIIVFSPIAVLLASYALVSLYDYASKQQHRLYRIFLIVLLLCILLIPSSLGTGSLTTFYKTTTQMTHNSGPIYSQQWQQAMQWVRENTPKNAVFVHWWDYGYWVQTGGERATVSDGGNNGGAGINYYTARYLLTAPDDQDVLSYMKARGADYALIVSEDVGKYPAFSTIGSDTQNDRYSWITAYGLDPKQTRETRNETYYVYTGGTALDEDFIYNDHLFPKQNAGIGAFLITYNNKGDNNATLARPLAVLVHNGQQYTVPVNCIVIQGQRFEFGKDGLDSCIAVIPSITDNKINPVGALLHLSRKVKDSFLARYYVYGLTSPYFSLVYNDAQNVPLAYYNGRIIGPHKIWKANFPPNFVGNATLASNELPDPRLYYAVS